MNGVYVRSDVSSMLSFDGSESRESVDDSKKGNVIYSLVYCLSFRTLISSHFI